MKTHFCQPEPNAPWQVINSTDRYLKESFSFAGMLLTHIFFPPQKRVLLHNFCIVQQHKHAQQHTYKTSMAVGKKGYVRFKFLVK